MSWAVSLASCLDRLDLQAAVAIVAKERNDLLPRRHEDLITENLGEDWTATISDEIRSHEYRPEPTQAVAVPKSRFSTRPAGVLPLKDRVVFEALVNPCREKVESILIDKNRVFWPRGVVAPSRWAEFEESPLKDGVTHIVLGDVAGFYESVDHAILRRLILDATGHLDLAEALSGFLTRTMGRDRGMPQGVAASDVLATLYLSPVDAAMMEQGLDFTRHGDDMRVAAKSYGEGLRVAHLMEHAMRRQKLLPNSSKLQVRKRSSYRSELRDVDDQVDSLKEGWRASVEARLDSAEDGDSVIDELIRAGVDVGEIGWDWYHGIVDYRQLVELIRENLTPDMLAVAQDLLNQAFRVRPNSGGVPAGQQISMEQFKKRFIFGLTTLQAGNDLAALRYCETVLLDYPNLTEPVCEYVGSCAEKDPAAVERLVQSVLRTEDVYILDWQRTWLYRVIFEMARTVESQQLIGDAEGVWGSDAFDWILRVEASKILAVAGRLEIESFRRAWRSCPIVYRPDLVVSACFVGLGSHEFSDFLQSVRSDRVLNALVRHLYKLP